MLEQKEQSSDLGSEGLIHPFTEAAGTHKGLQFTPSIKSTMSPDLLQEYSIYSISLNPEAASSKPRHFFPTAFHISKLIYWTENPAEMETNSRQVKAIMYTGKQQETTRRETIFQKAGA